MKYAFRLLKDTPYTQKDDINADIESMDKLWLEPEYTPTAVFVEAAAGYQVGNISTLRPGNFIKQTREQYYQQTHLQTIKFEIAKQIVFKLVGTNTLTLIQRVIPNFVSFLATGYFHKFSDMLTNIL